MPAAWVAWKRILSCKQDTHLSVFDPKCSGHAPTPVPPPKYTTNAEKGSCGINAVPHVKKRRSTSVCCNDLKNVVHGNTRVVHRGDDDSPLSHHYSGPHQLKILMQPQETNSIPSFSSIRTTPKVAHSNRLPGGCYDCSIDTPNVVHVQTPNHSRSSLSWYPPSTCHKCGETIHWPAEEHHVTHHAVTELKEGDSAQSIVEIIFQTSWLRLDIPCVNPEQIFKVHNSPKTVGKFEEYREMVKAKASKNSSSRKQSRCLVDGNELLRFYGTTISCRMGKTHTSLSSTSLLSSLCTSSTCGVCQILRHGFPMKGQPGIYTNASSGWAHESLLFGKASSGEVARGAMIICRVIAGRVKKAGLESLQDVHTSNGYDSVSGECGSYGDMEELLVFNSRAVLPCFVVVYSYEGHGKPSL